MEAVIEVMRPLSTTALPGMPGSLRGVAIVRGVTSIVVSLAGLLGEDDVDADRWVSLRGGTSMVIAARVLDVGAIEGDEIDAGRALVRGVVAPFVAAVVTHAKEMTAILDVAKIRDIIATDVAALATGERA